MKIVDLRVLGGATKFEASAGWRRARAEVETAIERVVWPPGASDFAINPTRHGNGVVALKVECMTSLRQDNWQVEQKFELPSEHGNPGPIDAQKLFGTDLVLLEWETGNISSSHRALNKMSVAIRHDLASAGVLIVPDSKLAKFLTDRIGNIRELNPYMDLWQAYTGEYGPLAIYVVSHDKESHNVPLLPKGLDGQANQYRKRLLELKLRSEPLT